ncbi:arylsulfatase [Mucilaginibacter mali]|uniref:Arylsulfatase n=1 Tax=Mucilaginibacter mali TaxID=2740462 RepID=A0A7D4Q445_9SPHI|nr:arylsulfatase [Mucilaginibacter mali]QKJ32706.1 arylsulfatase [Mucilaginibacter mali]
MKKISLPVLALLFSFSSVLAQAIKPLEKPNIIYILTDDLGIGDVSFYNKTKGKLSTPNIDRLAHEGMAFNDVHSSSAVCTPSRYSILTGRYAWRSRLKSGVLSGYDKPLIDSDRYTVGKLLQQNGYTTACIGKWHLGLGWSVTTPGAKPVIDYTKNISNGPTTLGFDYFYGIAASLDMPPFIFIENNHTVGLPTATKKWVREGPAGEDFEAVNCVPALVDKASAYIKDKAAKKQAFFLYFTLPSPHTPIVPSDKFKGKSGITEYGDYVMETDWAVGEILKAVDEGKIAKNTLIMFTSDNGFAPYVLKTMNVEALGHYPSIDYRGYKSDIWEGGHRIPYIVRWPGHVAAGSHCDKTVCLGDFMATTAAILHQKLPDAAGVDSYSILPYLSGNQSKDIREATVHHSIDGNFAIRQGKWKLELCAGSGGWELPKNPEALKNGMPPVQLYDMETDVKEEHNVQDKHPDVVKHLITLLQQYVDNGRSTPGKPQKNDGAIDIWMKSKNVAAPAGAEKAGD